MKLKFDEIRKTCPFLEWAMINAITIKNAIKDVKTDDGFYDISFKINGIELPIIETFNNIMKQDEERIEQAAKELIENKFCDTKNEIDDILEEMKDFYLQKLEKCSNNS